MNRRNTLRDLFLATPEGRIHYLQEGTGPVVLLLHAIGSSSRAWRAVIPLLSTRFSVYALDILGHGDSDKPPRDFMIPDWADNLVAFMRGLAIAKAHVVGNAVGGTIAVDLAVRHPQVVDKLALLSCPGWDTEEYRMARWQNMQKFLLPDGSAKPQTVQDVARNFAHVTPDALDQASGDRKKAGTWYRKTLWAQYSYDTPAMAKRVSAPTLVSYGDTDFLRDKAHALIQAIRGSRLEMIQGASHIMPVDTPEAVAKMLVGFLG